MAQIATVGSDPEVFVTDNDGKIISAIGLIGGSKKEPLPVNKGALQEDNVLAEFNIDPATSAEEFSSNIDTVLDALKGKLGDGRGISVISSHNFEPDQLLCKEAREFGCDPDFNAWTEDKNPVPAAGGVLRTAGGHVHIGYENPTFEDTIDLMRMCDIYLGLPSVLLDPDVLRRTLYGKAGACRIKVYGGEYRTLSNFWIKHKEYRDWVFNTVQYIVNNVDKLFDLMDHEGLDGELSDIVQNTINTSDVAKAKELCELFNIPVPTLE